MKTRKILSGLMCISMLLTGFPAAFANEATTDIWNSAYVTDSTKELYEDFPIIIDSNITKDMGMTIQLQYLKNYSETDSITVTISDEEASTVIAEYNLSEYGSHIIWNEVENNKSFSIHISENIDGVEKEYTGIINTQNVKADFPADITLGKTVWGRVTFCYKFELASNSDTPHSLARY